jgi:hypothetical protein
MHELITSSKLSTTTTKLASTIMVKFAHHCGELAYHCS